MIGSESRMAVYSGEGSVHMDSKISSSVRHRQEQSWMRWIDGKLHNSLNFPFLGKSRSCWSSMEANCLNLWICLCVSDTWTVIGEMKHRPRPLWVTETQICPQALRPDSKHMKYHSEWHSKRFSANNVGPNHEYCSLVSSALVLCLWTMSTCVDLALFCGTLVLCYLRNLWSAGTRLQHNAFALVLSAIGRIHYETF